MELKFTSATKVGAWVIGITIVAVIILTWLGIIAPFGKKQNEYRLHFHFPSIKGLNKGAKFKINGNEVGFVEHTDISPISGVDVAVKIYDKKYKIHENANVIITKESLLGSSYIEVSEPIGGFFEKYAETTGQFYVQIISGKIQTGDYLHFIDAGKQRIAGQVMGITQTDQGFDRLLVNQIDKSIEFDNTYAFVPQESKVLNTETRRYETTSYIDVFPALKEDSYFQGSREAGPEDLIAHVDQVVLQTGDQIDTLNQEMLSIFKNIQTLIDDVEGLIDKQALEDLFNTLKVQIENIGSNIENVTYEVNQLVGENRPRIDSIVQNIEATSNSIRETAEDPIVKDTVKDLSEKLNSISTRIDSILGDIEEITGDPELKADLKESIAQTRKTIDTASETIDKITEKLETASTIDISGEVKSRYQIDPDRYLSDINFKVRVGDQKQYALFGLDEIGEEDKFNAQIGYNIDDSLETRMGIRRSKVGFGLDYHADRFFIKSDLYDPNDIVFDVWTGIGIDDDVYLLLGGENLFEEDIFNLGVLIEF